MPLSITEFLSRLSGVTPRGDSAWMAQCPAHDDRKQSLSVKVGRVQPIVFFCHAGCVKQSILDVLRLTLADVSAERHANGGHGPSAPRRARPVARTLVAAYAYCGLDGALRYEAVRYDPKDFRQRRPDGEGGWIWNMDGVEKLPYRLDEIAGFCRMGKTTVVVVEGEKDADALWDVGIPATTNAGGAGGWSEALARLLKLAGVREVLALPDNDEPGRAHAAQVIATCRAHGMVARLLVLDGLEPHGDASDFLAAHGADAFRAAMVEAQVFTPLTKVHDAFRRWMGPEYDLQVLDVVLAAAASHWLDGDPCWVMVVAGSGAAKTETIVALEGASGIVMSNISNVAALLSASPRRDRAADATGGFLKQVGDNGLLIFKDMTSLLSKDHSARGELLSALREIHDGSWSRLVGSEGGRRLDWKGRITMMAACTTEWDRAHDAIAAMGDRWLIVRFDSDHGRQAAFDQAQANNGHEAEMRRELSAVVGAALAQVDRTRVASLTAGDMAHLFALADLTTKVRTAVARDYREDVIQAHAAEMPTRFGKQLGQLVRGGMALGMSHEAAVGLAVRAAQDSLPPLKWDVLHDVAVHPRSTINDVKRRLAKPYTTMKRLLEALMVQNLVLVDEERDGDKYTVKAQWIPGIEAISKNPVTIEAAEEAPF